MNADFRLAGWIIRPQRDCMERGQVVVHIKPKAMAVLECLARADGNVVTRDELFDAVWPNGEVTDDALTQCIVELRKAFGDSARHPKIIETIPKVGFRLVATVVPLNNEGDGVSVNRLSKTNSKIALLVLSTTLIVAVLSWHLIGLHKLPHGDIADGEKSIAVLPFVDMSANGDQGYFADGLTEELTNRLAQIKGLSVAGRTAAFYFKDRNDGMQDIAEALGVNHLLEGSVRRDERRLRITAQLIDASNGYHLWSRQFDRPFKEIFDIQDEIAESVANALSIRLQVGELATMPGGTSSVEAYEEIILSKRDQWESTPDSIPRAIDHVKKSIEIDPGYAFAWYRLAGLYLNANVLPETEGQPGSYLQVEQSLAEARRLEPELPGVRSLTVMLMNKKRQWPEVENTLNRGAGLENSMDAELIKAYCGFLLRVGRIREAIPLLERDRHLLPYSSTVARVLGSAYIIQDRIEEGLAETERAFELEGFEPWDVEIGMLTALSTGDREVLLKWMERAERYMPESRQLIVAMREFLDDPEAALDWLRNIFAQTERHDCQVSFWAAFHGETGLAIDALKRCPAPMYFWHKVMKDVRQTPGFKDLIRQLDLEEYYREFGWNDFCYPLNSEDFACDLLAKQ